jgi:uncharacterized protein (DUF2249 family)
MSGVYTIGTCKNRIADVTADEVDVRHVPKPQRHPMIFERFSGMAAGEAFVLINSHDPRHLHDEFERDHPGRYSWDYLETGPTEWRVRIGKSAAAELPRVVCNAYAVDNHEASGDAAGALWKLGAGSSSRRSVPFPSPMETLSGCRVARSGRSRPA